MPPKVLGDVFAATAFEDHPQLLVGFDHSDDGSVFQIDEAQALVQSVDFFTPIVDNAFDFGAISAANALSDIYAMGGQPLTALSLLCFPFKTLDLQILKDIVAGGSEKIREAGAMVTGGHSVGDTDIKFGYAVTGKVHPKKYWQNHTPQPGDALVLTKPLGTGVLATAAKKDLLDSTIMDRPIAEMKRLNRTAAQLGRRFQVHAATDITGFGLLGHLFEMIHPKKLGAQIQTAQLPIFDGIWQAIEAGAVTAAHHTNRVYLEGYPLADTPALTRYAHILFDPQTSGGLLMALPPEEAPQLVTGLRQTGHDAACIGHITRQAGIRCQ